MDKEKVVRDFLTFAETKGVSLGGNVVYGFALEHEEFRPMHRDDYSNLINAFLKASLEEAV